MSKRLIGAQKPFRMLVANLTGGSDPSRGAAGNPVKKRSTFQQQRIFDIPGRGFATTGDQRAGTGSQRGVLLDVSVPAAGATGSITLDAASWGAAVFGKTEILLGGNVIQIGDVLDPDPNASATDLAAAIAAIPGFAANSVANVVNITGPVGPVGNFIQFEVAGISAYLMTLSPADGTLSGAEPSIGPPDIT